MTAVVKFSRDRTSQVYCILPYSRQIKIHQWIERVNTVLPQVQISYEFTLNAFQHNLVIKSHPLSF